ncbi:MULTISPECIES: DEAD/DEAH box helicase [Niastella]|uniref:DEAD/DEAH box helicase n=1 Tax=Niastella soli TaxID=2821487 RepID=A0ABS3YQD3_9BACT|nr:DEAD/DEAH box helicase [Niastella soli]MBO9200102.1 DEAD/DEAH box helicase [Niastella soli]
MRFTEFGFHPDLLEGIEASNYENATPVQEQVIPPILAGRDIIASAQTGTGKTAAFLLPLINRLLTHRIDGQVGALVIVPTRELAIQIAQHLEGLSYFTNLSSIAVYGGNDGSNFVAEKKALQTGTDIVICTPGRMIAHLNMGYVQFKQLQFLVLDEADRMLDMGFQDDINKIIGALPAKRQTLLFSATMPEKIRQLARKILTNPAEINIAISKPPEKIVQKAFVVYEPQKLPLLKHILTTIPFKSALIFCSRKQSVKLLVRDMERAKFKIAEIHSDLEQSQREDVLNGFTSGRIPILAATDILSRGIDIDTIDLVINYDVPRDAEDYVHRIGRTARAEADGMAFTLVSEPEQNKFAIIEKLIGKEVEKAAVPEELGKTPEYQPRLRPKSKGGNRRYHHHGKPRRK